MLVRLALVAVSLLMAAAASATPLFGVWRSGRDLALLEAEKHVMLTLGQREVLPTSDLLGQLAAIHGDRQIELRLAEKSTRLSYQTVATGSDFAEVEYDDEGAAEPVRARLLLHGGLLYAPVEDTAFDEVFRRIDAPAALAP
jgi:hypothetical protein